jgi:hypothetical protein
MVEAEALLSKSFQLPALCGALKRLQSTKHRHAKKESGRKRWTFEVTKDVLKVGLRKGLGPLWAGMCRWVEAALVSCLMFSMADLRVFLLLVREQYHHDQKRGPGPREHAGALTQRNPRLWGHLGDLLNPEFLEALFSSPVTPVSRVFICRHP